MKKSYFLVLLVLAFSSNVNADLDTKDIAKCAVIKGDLSRLECYDRLAENNDLRGIQNVPQTIEDTGDWDVSVGLNPIDDSKTVTLALKAETGTSRWGDPIFIVARCKSNETNLYISWNDYLGSEVEVLTRVGESKAAAREWGLSTDKKASFHPKPVNFLKKLLDSDKLVAQVTPYNENPVTAIFNTTGLGNAIKPLRQTCSW
ncbi:type VI secretion system-associated protein TagO [Motilimonas pumila]|uniref:Type VI secretion system-associated protein TagO n=1 Tax=Motilimonas pumila TaxID=2303987 RepID=A0A418YKN1_9GAMM|nr:type VI secretion system-associated protein TagO [Motilimonas pumila]RJG51538.1 hypothetical protein D1Z90_02060 [Motilimonas pumila]